MKARLPDFPARQRRSNLLTGLRESFLCRFSLRLGLVCWLLLPPVPLAEAAYAPNSSGLPSWVHELDSEGVEIPEPAGWPDYSDGDIDLSSNYDEIYSGRNPRIKDGGTTDTTSTTSTTDTTTTTTSTTTTDTADTAKTTDKTDTTTGVTTSSTNTDSTDSTDETDTTEDPDTTDTPYSTLTTEGTGGGTEGTGGTTESTDGTDGTTGTSTETTTSTNSTNSDNASVDLKFISVSQQDIEKKLNGYVNSLLFSSDSAKLENDAKQALESKLTPDQKQQLGDSGIMSAVRDAISAGMSNIEGAAKKAKDDAISKVAGASTAAMNTINGALPKVNVTGTWTRENNKMKVNGYDLIGGTYSVDVKVEFGVDDTPIELTFKPSVAGVSLGDITTTITLSGTWTVTMALKAKHTGNPPTVNSEILGKKVKVSTRPSWDVSASISAAATGVVKYSLSLSATGNIALDKVDGYLEVQ
jgi:hypothetical protein